MIAIDAMGGDFAPSEVVRGAVNTAQKGVELTLFGDEMQIIRNLEKCDPAWRQLPITIVQCSEIIGMAEEPSRCIVEKGDSSLVRAVKAVANGQAKAIVSAGNSGAALVAGMIHGGKIPGILRPAIGGFLPTRTDSVFCIDLGANVDCKPEYLRQFALMGDAYVRLVKGIKKAKIALLSNGTEPGKGNKLMQQVHALLSDSSLHFVGNCEPSDIFNDVADVIVCEGFSGNIMLKSMEATVQVVMQWLKDEGNRSLFARCAGILGAPVFRRLKKHIMKGQRGGALLLGVAKPLVIAHGASRASDIEDAIHFAHHIVSTRFHEQFNQLVTNLLQEMAVHGNNAMQQEVRLELKQ